jgi:ABC-type Co2+ transport system permease subunit
VHIPNEYLSEQTWKTAVFAGGLFAAMCARRVGQKLNDRQILGLAISAGAAFGLQMITFPVLGDASQHLVGGFLITLFFGPWAASLSIAGALVMQTVLLGTGVSSLGADFLNMGIAVPFAGAAIFAGALRLGEDYWWRVGTVFVSTWASMVAASCLIISEVHLSGIVKISASPIVYRAAIVGLMEAAITTIIYAVVAKYRPGVLWVPEPDSPPDQRRSRKARKK